MIVIVGDIVQYTKGIEDSYELILKDGCLYWRNINTNVVQEAIDRGGYCKLYGKNWKIVSKSKHFKTLYEKLSE